MQKSNYDAEFKKLKSFSFTKSTVTFWIVQRSLKKKVAKYTVKNVQIDESLELKLRSIISNKVRKSNNYTQYEFFTADADDNLLTINSNETDFDILVEQINDGADGKTVKTNDDLYGSWAYIIKIENKTSSLLAFKKIEEIWDVKKRGIKVLFKDEKFIDLKEDNVFKVEKTIDFICFNSILFVINKKKFELGLNFREGMKTKRDELLKELDSLSIVSDIEIIKEKVGENMNYLRQLSSIHKNGYFRNSGFMDSLIKVNKNEGWGLSIIDNQIQIDNGNIESVLKILNKDRLKDLIEGETFDVTVKKSVSVN
jgi:hypothetical protein